MTYAQAGVANAGTTSIANRRMLMVARTLDQRRAARIKRSMTPTASYPEVEHYMRTIRDAREGLTALLHEMLDRVVGAMSDGSLPVALLTYDIGPCHCLCGVHNHATGGICELTPGFVVVLVGGVISPSERPMCRPCARWWYAEKGDRVGEFTRIEDGRVVASIARVDP
jgi:hypothetical protein